MSMAATISTVKAHSLSAPLRKPRCRRPFLPTLAGSRSRTHSLFPSPFPVVAVAKKKKNDVHFKASEEAIAKEEVENVERSGGTFLYSVAPYPLMLAAALPGAETVRTIFGPIVEVVKTLNLPDWLVHWGHPANMAVVLFAMGGYGSYLGFRIRLSKNPEEKAMAKDLHPKLLGGMFFFFALGATGGIISLLTSGRPILESPHAVTGLIGLSLLTVQTILPSLFEENPGLRTVHGLFGSSIMTIFLIHAALGLQLGLSF